MALLKLSPDVRGDLSVILGRVDDGLGMDVEGVEVCGCACAAVPPCGGDVVTLLWHEWW